MLRKYISNLSYVLETPLVELREDLSFEIQPVGILDHREKVLRNKVVLMEKNTMEKRQSRRDDLGNGRFDEKMLPILVL